MSINWTIRRFVTLFSLAGLAGIIGLLVSGGCATKPKKPLDGGAIHGHVVAVVRGDFAAAAVKPLRVELPDAGVTARNVSTNTTTAAVMTNAHGYFQLPHVQPGNYEPRFRRGVES